uniref:Phospholipase A2 domain-containing protein n=1 Tax=Ananas comosus var. bracteatus TaxID=296719 RepID=A0A6V7PRP1_ANACO|nr:unnamed protein product [Ananas comosus var. bracteatus]
MLSEARSLPCFQLVFDVATFESSIGSVKLDLEYSKYSRSSLTEPIDDSKVATLKTSWKHGRLLPRIKILRCGTNPCGFPHSKPPLPRAATPLTSQAPPSQPNPNPNPATKPNFRSQPRSQSHHSPRSPPPVPARERDPRRILRHHDALPPIRPPPPSSAGKPPPARRRRLRGAALPALRREGAVARRPPGAPVAALPRYGHYCGPNWSSGKNGGSMLWDQRPIDWLDFCCYCHDIGYDTYDQAKLLKADLAFLECLEKPRMATKGGANAALLYRAMCIAGLRSILIPYRTHLVNLQSGPSFLEMFGNFISKLQLPGKIETANQKDRL